MAINYLNHIDLNQNELQNAVVQNLALAPSNPVEGQTYWNTNTKKGMIFNGTEWQESSVPYVLPKATDTVLGGVTIGSNINVNDGEISVYDASTDHKGVIEIATDSEATTGTSETLAVNPKQLATKVTANNAITGATKTKITYDSKGLVTAGADLAASDIPALDSSKITTLDNYAKGTVADIATTDTLDQALGKLEAKADEKVVANSAITASATGKTVITYDAKGLVTGGSEIGIDSGSTNYLEFDTTNHNIKAKVDTTVTENSTKLITSGAVHTAIQNAVVGGVLYKGTWDITSATDFSGITLPVKQGYLYYVIGTGPKTIGGIEWNAGDYLMVNEDVAAGGSLSGKVQKIDNTEAADIVRLNATQTLTNKTIDADDNTISDLTTSNLKSGVLQTSVRAAASATDTTLASEKAIRTELDKKQDKVTTATENHIATWDANGNTKDSGKSFVTSVGTTGADTNIPTEKAVRSAITTATDGMVTLTGTQTLTNKTIDADDNTIQDLTVSNLKSGVLQTTVRASSSATDTTIVSEKAVATAVEALPHKYVATNPALTATAGVCTWTVTHGLADGDTTVIVKQVSDGAVVIPEIIETSTGLQIKINSTSNIAAGTYKVVVIG